eukprot:8794642-Heterocapsa_arctica.AAC.1
MWSTCACSRAACSAFSLSSSSRAAWSAGLSGGPALVPAAGAGGGGGIARGDAGAEACGAAGSPAGAGEGPGGCGPEA